MLSLDLAIEDALFRIRREYKRTNGKIYLAFSGGKDSTVLAELIKMADLPEKIPFVFANTRIEFDATYAFVKNFPYENIVITKPRKPFGQILKEYGKPAISKKKSDYLKTYQNHIENPLETYRARQLITGEMERKGGIPVGVRTKFALADKHFHFLHPDLGYKVANKCCTYMKKYPFEDYAAENDMAGAFNGMRIAEGGARATAYTSCVHVKNIKGKEFLMSMPMFDWSDDLVWEFVNKYNIKLSDAYTKYGCERTGCVGCPFAKESDLKKELKAVYEHEPNRYKAAISWLGDVYIDYGIKLEFDENYMEKYKERAARNERFREEMLNKFHDVRLKNKEKPKQLELFEVEARE